MEIPNEWTFKNKDIATAFNLHVREQLPWYDLATRLVEHIVRNYTPKNGLIYDIGASTGNIGNAIADIIKTRNATLISIEESTEMCELNKSIGDVININALEYEFKKHDVSILFLVLMFIPTSKRKKFILNLVEKLNDGGVLIIFDKISNDGYMQNVMQRLTINEKLKNGADYESVIKKEFSLSGLQRPIDDDFLNSIPFKKHMVFKFGEFVGYVIEKNE
jgi:tRNA (cmo5U34)-methyltransferase